MQALYEEIRQDGYGDVVHCTSVHPYFVSTRKDLMDWLKLRFPPITAERTANEAVDAMLRNELQVSVPSWNMSLLTMFKILSFKNQQLIRDYILKENDTYNIKSLGNRNRALNKN